MTALEIHIDKALATDAVQRLECALLNMPQAGIVTSHKFLPGIYERTISIPPFTVLTGAPHKTAYQVRLDQGTIAVNTDDGIKVLTAPCTFNAPAGVKRVGLVFDQPVIWTDIYVNEDDCHDLSVLESRFYDLSDCDLGETRRLTLERQKEVMIELMEGDPSWQVG